MPLPEPKESRSQDIFDHLVSKDFSVFWPAQHNGEVEKPYVVVRVENSSQVEDYSSDFQYYSLLCYVPKNMYGHLEIFVERVKREMKELYPMIVYVHGDTPSYFDNEIKGHMISLPYRNARKWNNQKEFD